MSTVPFTTLRERKQNLTRFQLEKAAVELVLREGLEGTTVAAISSLAAVSNRTFFNYFDSKESAILGLRTIDLTGGINALRLAWTDGADLAEAVVHLMVGIVAPAIKDGATHQSRAQIIRQYPQLLGQLAVHMDRMRIQLTDAVDSLLAGDPRFAGADCTGPPVWTEVMLAMCGSAVRATLRQWATAGGTGTMEDLEQNAVSLVRETAGRMQ